MRHVKLGGRIAAVLATIGALGGCIGGQTASHTTAPPAGGVTSPHSTPPTLPPDCPVTLPSLFEPPPGVSRDALFGAGTSHGNGRLWVGGLGDGGVIEVGPAEGGVIGVKFGWWRVTAGDLKITGRRIDGIAPPVRADVPDGYGETGFQASGVYFPTVGCWEVTGQVGATALTFVTYVVIGELLS